MTGDAGRQQVVVGVGGGIAAYKAAELIRRIRETPAGLRPNVTVVPTESALRFVGAPTFEALSGNPVRVDVFSDVPEVAHVATGQHADLVIVAPATADLLARAANGRADDLLTATLLVTRAPVLFAPAMHTEMWTHPATQTNVAALRSHGAIVLDPAVGRLTGADSGPGRLPDPDHLAQLAELLLLRPDALPRDLAGVRITITAGGTREPLDPVRFLGNRSSGQQGYALALVAAARGADVTLIAANTDLPTPPNVRLVAVTTAREMLEAVRAQAADAIIMAAAVADFRPADTHAAKIKKDGTTPRPLNLVENPDILTGLVTDRGAASRPIIVGFAAETGDDAMSVLTYGRAKLARKGCDLLVVNDVADGKVFGRPDTAAVILDADGGEQEITPGPKALVAAAVADRLAELLG